METLFDAFGFDQAFTTTGNRYPWTAGDDDVTDHFTSLFGATQIFLEPANGTYVLGDHFVNSHAIFQLGDTYEAATITSDVRFEGSSAGYDARVKANHYGDDPNNRAFS